MGRKEIETRSIEFAESVINTVREPLISLDQDLRVVTASRSFYEFFQVKPEDTVGQLIYDLGNKQWDIPQLRELLETILPEKTSFDNYEVEHEFATIGRRIMLLNARQITRKRGKERIILLAIEDITARKEIESGLETTRKELAVIKELSDEAHEFADSVINTVREPLISLDQDLRVVTASRSFYQFFQVKPEDTVGQLIYDLGNKQWDIPQLRELLETILPEKTSFDNYEVEHEFATIGRRIMLLNARQIKRGRHKERSILLAVEDITERKRLEELLTESEFRYRRVFETASDGIVLLEKTDGHIVQANPAVEKMLGYDEADYIGKKLEDIGVALDTSNFPEIMQDLATKGILNYEDIPVTTKSGQDIPADIYMVDRAHLAQCNIRDVSERKLAAEALQEEKVFIENALNTLQDIFLVFDLKGKFLRWNKTLKTVTGYSDSEIGLMSPKDFFRDNDIKTISDSLQEVVREGSDTFEVLLRTKDGRPIPYEISAALLSDAFGKAVGITGVARDITERKQAEHDLRAALDQAYEGEHRLEAIMASMGEGLSVQNADFIITYQNQAMIDLVGDHIGEHCYRAYENQEGTCGGCPVAMAYADGSIHKVARTITSGEEIKYLEVTASSLKDMQGHNVGVIEVIRDVSEQKKLEAQLLQAQKMEAIGTLAGGIAHDFNNILNVILGYGAMVMDSLATGSQAKNDMQEVLLGAEKAADLTKRLLVFSRKTLVEVRPVNINELILGLQKMLARIIRENIDFQLDLMSRPLIVQADAGQIEQVLINLALNARDAILEGGRLIISTGIEEIDEGYIAAYGYGQPGSYALITIADTGHGMDAETQKRIFEPFFTTKGVGEGTGLGLAISYGIIQQHGGYIKVYSEPGQGTVFKIYLPLGTETASADTNTASITAVKGGDETILVAEDDDSLRKLTGIVLESFGYQVITARDGEDAITKFMANKDRINLVMLDMIMPKKNGQEVGMMISNVSPGMKTLFVSGYTMDTIMNPKLTEGGFDFIQKPFQSKHLLAKVREILDR